MAFNCEICGKTLKGPQFTGKFSGVCTSCFTEKFWRLIVEEKDQHIFINHESYTLGSETESHKGFDGRAFKIRMKADGRIIETHNLWYQGNIPEHLWGELPDNAEFVK